MKENLADIFNKTGKLPVIIDTDTYNEIDDYFALAYALGRTDKLEIKGITVAPFFNERCQTIEEGISLSRREVERVLSLTNTRCPVRCGGARYLPDEYVPVESDAADFIVQTAKDYDEKNRLYVVAIGAITNVASALLKDKTLRDRIAVVWLGGNAFHEEKNDEFNLRQDIAGARVLFSSRVPLLQVPCMGVVSAFYTGKQELTHFLKGKNAISDYLLERTVRVAEEESKVPTWSRVIWDVVAVGALLNENGRFMQLAEKRRRLPAYGDFSYGEETALPMLYVERVCRDELLYDLFTTLGKFEWEKGL